MPERFIPEHIDPIRFAEQGLGLDGAVKLSDMPRLSSLIQSNEGKVLVNLNFGIDEQGITYLKGHLETQLTLQCQRCMEPLIYEIMSDFVLGIINTLDEANTLPAVYEPAMAKEGSLALRDLIEDEVILNLPIIPRHEPEDCKVQIPLTDSEWEKEKNKSPFHVLASLKHKEQ